MKTQRVVLCLSGGLDSSVTAALYCHSTAIVPIFFEYGQASAIQERHAAQAVARTLRLDLQVERLPTIQPMNEDPQAPYYPFRNLAFAVHAAAFAQRIGACGVWFGFVADTNPEKFPDAIASFCTATGAYLRDIYRDRHRLKISAPVADQHKVDLVVAALTVGFDMSQTYSCYRSPKRCGECAACEAVRGAFVIADSRVGTDQQRRLRELNPYSSEIVATRR